MHAPFYCLFLMENFMASISHTEDPVCYLCIRNSWYSISSAQLSIVNNSLLRKFSIAAFVYSATMTFSTHPASLPSCSSTLVSSVSQVQLYFCYYCSYLPLQVGIEFTVVSPGCCILSFVSGYPFLWVFIWLSHCPLPPYRNAPKLIFLEPNLSLRQSFLWITCKPGKRSIVKSVYHQPFFLIFLIERGKHRNEEKMW